VGRPDAAGGEDVIVAMAECVQRIHDLGLDVGNHAHFAEIDAEVGEILGDVADVLVLGTAGQDLIADDQDGGTDDGGRLAFMSLCRLNPERSSTFPHQPLSCRGWQRNTRR